MFCLPLCAWLSLALLPTSSFAGKGKKVRRLSCKAACHVRLQQSLRWCIHRQREMLKQCRSWTVSRFKVCALNNTKARVHFCNRTYLERRSRCARWTKRRHQRCFLGHRQCLDKDQRFCSRLCQIAKTKKLCIRRCLNGRKPRCIRALRECRKKTFAKQKYCIAHAKHRDKTCSREVLGSKLRCKSFAQRASQTCRSHAQTRQMFCKKSALRRKAVCMKACSRPKPSKAPKRKSSSSVE